MRNNMVDCYIYELSKGGVPIYIGSTMNPKAREKAHRKCLEFDEMVVIDSCDVSCREALEIMYIQTYSGWNFNLNNIHHNPSERECYSQVRALVPSLLGRIDKLELTGYAMSAGVDGFVSPQLASKWISDLKKGTSSVTTYLAICKVLDIIEGEAKESVDKSSSSDKIDYSAPKKESKPVYSNPVIVEQKVSQKASIKPYPVGNTFPQQGDDIDLDHENMNTLDYECLSEHLSYVLAPEGKFLKQGGGVVFTHNNRGYKATPSQESPSVVFFEGQEKFKMETGYKGAIIVTKQG